MYILHVDVYIHARVYLFCWRMKGTMEVRILWLLYIIVWVPHHSIVNPRHACAVRVTVVGSVCPLIKISSLESLVQKTISCTQQLTKVKKCSKLLTHCFQHCMAICAAKIREWNKTGWKHATMNALKCKTPSTTHTRILKSSCTIEMLIVRMCVSKIADAVIPTSFIIWKYFTHCMYNHVCNCMWRASLLPCIRAHYLIHVCS